MTEFIFYFIAVCTGVFALLTVVARDVFHSAVWLAFTLLSISGIYFYLDAEFLGVIQILVYVGGIISLFVFAIKLTARIDDKAIPQFNEQVFPAALISLVLFFLLFRIIGSQPWAHIPAIENIVSLEQIGASLMSGYLIPFEFISLVLLAAMVGAIIIGKVKK